MTHQHAVSQYMLSVQCLHTVIASVQQQLMLVAEMKMQIAAGKHGTVDLSVCAHHTTLHICSVS